MTPKKNTNLPQDTPVGANMMAVPNTIVNWSAPPYNWSDPRIDYDGTAATLSTLNAVWSDPNFNWSDPRITYDGTIITQYSGTVVNVLYSVNQPNKMIYSPQIIRSRARHRGQRESEKVNLEMYQFLFDARKIYEFIGLNSNNLVHNILSLEYGSNLTTYFWSNYYPQQLYDASTYDGDSYDGPIFIDTPVNQLTIFNNTGSNDTIMRLNRLLTRVRALETSRIG